MQEVIVVERSGPLYGTVLLHGAKNAVLVMMAASVLPRGVTRLRNVPTIADVTIMGKVLGELGIIVTHIPEANELVIDATTVSGYTVSANLMRCMRASILVMGSLLARCGAAKVGLPGGDAIGERPIDFHLKAFKRMNIAVEMQDDNVYASTQRLCAARIVLEYPSVGATENVILAALGAHGRTTIINASLEPEVLDFIQFLRVMGAAIIIEAPATIHIEGGVPLVAAEYTVMSDRLEAGSLLLATAVTGGTILLPNAQAHTMDLFLTKLQEMGHQVELGEDNQGIFFKAVAKPTAVSIKTAPYPGFPTDLQAPMCIAQLIAHGSCTVEETVHDNRLQHIPELYKMGAKIDILSTNKARLHGGTMLMGALVTANDIRTSLALVLAGLIAQGETRMRGVHHWRRGYESLEITLAQLGASIHITQEPVVPLQGIVEPVMIR
jgi:UDP-N-acetylglucosamine 1-carboxyvinyltransferase